MAGCEHLRPAIDEANEALERAQTVFDYARSYFESMLELYRAARRRNPDLEPFGIEERQATEAARDLALASLILRRTREARDARLNAYLECANSHKNFKDDEEDEDEEDRNVPGEVIERPLICEVEGMPEF